MNIQGGGLSFEISGTNKQLLQVLNESKKAIQTFSTEAVKGGKDIEKVFEAAKAAIDKGFRQIDTIVDTNDAAIRKLKAQYNELGKALNTAYMTPGAEKEITNIQNRRRELEKEIKVRQQIINEAGQQADALLKEEQALNERKAALDNMDNKYESIRTQLRKAKEELMQMAAAGKRGTEEYAKQQQEVARLTAAMKSSNKQATVLANPNKMFAGVISGLTLMTSGYQAVTGAMGLFAGENENLQRIMVKVQSLMSITMALQTAYTQLNKNSAFQLVLVAKAKDMLTAANARLAAALGVSNAMATVLMSTLTLGLAAAITAVIAIIEHYTSKQAEAKKQADEFNKKVAEAAVKPVFAYKELQSEWLSLTGSMKDKEKWVQDNADKFTELGFNVTNAKQAEDLLIRNTANFTAACIAKAKALAAQNLASEKYEAILKKQAEIDAMPDKTSTYVQTSSFGTGYWVEGENTAKKKAKQELAEKQKNANALIQQQIKFTQEEQAYLKKIGMQAGQVVAGSVEAAEKELSRLRDLYKKAGTDAERNSLAKKIATQEAEVERLSYKSSSKGGKSGGSGSKSTKDPYAEELTTKEAVLSDFDAQLNKELEQCKNVGEQLAVIAKKREELKNDNSDVDNAKKERLDTKETDIKEQAKKETAELLKEYAGYLQEKLDFEESYARNRELLTKQAAEASTEEERKVAEAALAALEKKRQEYAKRSGSEQYDKLLEEYQSYQQKQTAIQEKYSQQRAEAEKQGNLAMISQINAKEQEELSKLAASRLMATESWNQLFSDISRLSSSTIKKLLDDINNKKINLSAQFNPTDLKAINDQLMNARNELEKRNPFLSLKNSLSELRAVMKAEKLLESDDPFVKSLQEKKKQYQDYTDAVNSSDEILAGSAKDAYADLLSQGSTYIDFLRRKIAELNKQKVELKITTEGEEQLNVLQAALDKETGQSKSVSQGFKDAFKSIGSSIDFVSGCFDSVVGGIKKMGISMDEETEAILGDIGGMMDGASQLASGIATGNPLGVIQGSIGLLSSAFDLFNFRDRKAEKSIKRHQEAVKKLGYAYNELEHAVDKALGETVYQNQSAVIQNLRAQQNEIQGMISDEKGKKKSDKNRIAEWEEQYREVGRQIEDIIDDITQSITQATAGDLANNLADALVEAFEGGEDAAKAFGDVANDVLKNAVKNALKLQFLEKPLQNAIKQLQKDMGFDEEGNGTFDGLTEAEQARFKNAIKKAGANFAAAMDMYKDLFTDLDNTDPSTLSGAISSASQESIDLLAGQTNAVRQNQVTSIQLIREQLMHLANMDRGIGVIADRVQSIINHLTTAASDDNGLRSQGITD